MLHSRSYSRAMGAHSLQRFAIRIAMYRNTTRRSAPRCARKRFAILSAVSKRSLRLQGSNRAELQSCHGSDKRRALEIAPPRVCLAKTTYAPTAACALIETSCLAKSSHLLTRWHVKTSRLRIFTLAYGLFRRIQRSYLRNSSLGQPQVRYGRNRNDEEVHVGKSLMKFMGTAGLLIGVTVLSGCIIAEPTHGFRGYRERHYDQGQSRHDHARGDVRSSQRQERNRRGGQY